jgi:hypothetical protein
LGLWLSRWLRLRLWHRRRLLLLLLLLRNGNEPRLDAIKVSCNSQPLQVEQVFLSH